MRRCDCTLADEELDALFRVIDTDEDGRISYREFVDSILPTDPYTRSLVRSGGAY